MTAEDVSAALDLFAEIIARAYAAEHGLLRPETHDDLDTDGGPYQSRIAGDCRDWRTKDDVPEA